MAKLIYKIKKNSPPLRIAHASSSPEATASITVQGYCSTCKKNTDMKDAKEGRLRNGRKAITGKCVICDTLIIKTQGE